MGFPLEGRARQVSRLGIHRLAHQGRVHLSSPWFWVIREGGRGLPECADQRGVACSVGSDWSVCTRRADSQSLRPG